MIDIADELVSICERILPNDEHVNIADYQNDPKLVCNQVALPYIVETIFTNTDMP